MMQRAITTALAALPVLVALAEVAGRKVAA